MVVSQQYIQPNEKKSTKNNKNHSYNMVAKQNWQKKKSLIGLEKFELQPKRNSTKQHQWEDQTIQFKLINSYSIKTKSKQRVSQARRHRTKRISCRSH